MSSEDSAIAETIDIENQSDEGAEFAVLGGSPIVATDLHIGGANLLFHPLPAHSSYKYPIDDMTGPFAIFFRLAASDGANLGWWVTISSPILEKAVLKRPATEEFRLQADIEMKAV